MWIKREEYNRLLDCKHMKIELEEEVQRLAKLITAEVKDCQLGPWCKDCIHSGHDSSVVKVFIDGYSYVKEVDGQVQYCKKHLHEICPEFETG